MSDLREVILNTFQDQSGGINRVNLGLDVLYEAMKQTEGYNSATEEVSVITLTNGMFVHSMGVLKGTSDVYKEAVRQIAGAGPQLEQAPAYTRAEAKVAYDLIASSIDGDVLRINYARNDYLVAMFPGMDMTDKGFALFIPAVEKTESETGWQATLARGWGALCGFISNT